MRVETRISLDRENLLQCIISSFDMLGPNIITLWFHLFVFKLLFIFLVIFFFALFQISHSQFPIFSSSTSSYCLIIRLASLKYNQSPCGFDTWTSILIFTTCGKIGTLANKLTKEKYINNESIVVEGNCSVVI